MSDELNNGEKEDKSPLLNIIKEKTSKVLNLIGEEGFISQMDLVLTYEYKNTFEFINNHYKVVKGDDVIFYNPFTTYWYRPKFYDDTMLPCSD